jgi:CheY-like chemotaxis protein
VAASQSARGLKILLVDDNRDNLESLQSLLAMLGGEVSTASDGVEAVERAADLRPDVIFMDMGMPRLDGFEATRRIREQAWGRSPRIYAMTGWGQESDRQRSRAAGCDGHLVKPVELAALEEVLAGVEPQGRPAAARGEPATP